MIDPNPPGDSAGILEGNTVASSPAPSSEDESIARMREKERRANRAVVAIALIVCIASFFIGARGWMNAASWWAAGIAASAIAAGLAWLVWQRPSPAAYGPRIVARRTDEIQRGRSIKLLAFPLEVVCLAPLIVACTRYVIDRGGPKLLGLPEGIATTGFLLVMAVSILTMTIVTILDLMGAAYARAIRPVLDDELSRAHRSMAIASAFVVYAVGGITVYAAGLIEPRWAVLALPFLVMGPLAVAAVHFVILDRNAAASA